MGSGRVLGGLLVAAACLVACGDDDDGAAAEVGTVMLVQTGGIDGTTTEIVVTADGAGTLTFASEAPEEFTLDGDDLDQLHELVGGSEFADLDPSYVPDDPCCDLFFYEITAEVDGETRRVETADGGEHPDVVTDVIALLNDASS